MWLTPVTLMQSSDEPLTLETIKAWLRVDGTDEDNLINKLIAASRDYAENYCGACLKERSVSAKCTSFDDFQRLPIGPVQSITSITYLDENAEAQTLSGSVYELVQDGLEASISLQYGQSWPSILTVSFMTVTLVCGYDTLPPSLELALMLHIARHYEKREDAAQETTITTIDAILSNFRRGV